MENQTPDRRRAVVVGAGPNGLCAAARLARAGWLVTVFEAATTVGGGSRTAVLGHDAVYDVCSAVHPFGASSPAFAELNLEAHGLRWMRPPIALAHPFDDGSAAVLHADVDATAAELEGDDAARWRAIVGSLAERWTDSRYLAFNPVLQSMRARPLAMTAFGLSAILPAALLARRFAGRNARALLIGFAAHAGVRLSGLTTAGVGLTLAAAGHVTGMPVAEGGSQAVADALAEVIRLADGEIVCGHRVDSIRELPPADAVLLDVTPRQFAELAGQPTPRWKYGVGAHKLDLVLSGPMPWTAQACREAGTVHVGGDARAIARSERATVSGLLPDHPFLIVAQPSVADPSRAPSGQHVLWAYRHVPNGSADSRATSGIERQFDRFAPGWRDLVVHRRETSAIDFSAYNANYIGGDIAGGAMTPWQAVARPRLAVDPYPTRIPGVWLCSQSTPPGAGVHGMCGWNAAGSVLRHDRDRSDGLRHSLVSRFDRANRR